MRVKSFESFLNEEEEKTYSFEELSPEAKKKAIQNHYDININYDGWSDGVIEGFKEDMAEIGIEDPEVQFSGFYSQGDGASFTSEDIDTRKLFDAVGIESNEFLDMSTEDERRKGENKEFYDLLDTLEDVGHLDRIRIKPEELRVTIERIGGGRYYHENTVRANVEIWDEPDGWEIPPYFESELSDKVTDFIRGICRKLYRDLEKDYEHLTSEEAVAETLIDNGYEFDEEGNVA